VSGNLISQGTPLGKNSRKYDEENRLVLVETPDDSVELGYSGAGANTSIASGKARIETEYNTLGLVALERQGPHEVEVAWQGGRVSEISADVGVGLGFDIREGALQMLQAGGTTLQFIFPRAREQVSFLGAKLVRRDHYDQLGNLEWTLFARFNPQMGLGETGIAQTGGNDQLLLIEFVYNGHGELILEKRSDGRKIEYDLDIKGRITTKRVHRAGVSPLRAA